MKNFFSNKLIQEKSPYLLQHAHNPVDWHAWGSLAFEAAKTQDKPIFLSIGYATCHWCHVMEKESFENAAVAEVLNRIFICIKVDREELPEVDGLYMDFAQALMSSGGGWPLNVLLTPDLKPFYATTYLPPHNNHGMMGLVELCDHVEKIWKSSERSALFQQADEVIRLFTTIYDVQSADLPAPSFIHEAAKTILKEGDYAYGGVKGAPKFPLSYYYDFLLRYHATFHQEVALSFATLTLNMMKRGGLYDHLGGGFSRYSVDGKWMIPHFEKMLYDNALLAASYLEGYLATKDVSFKKVSEETLNYVLREMTHEEGGFFSAQDADSEGKEGLYYVWTEDEIEAHLQGEMKTLFRDYYHISKEGNFDGANVLYSAENLAAFAERKKLSVEYVEASLQEAKKILFRVRNLKEAPLKDDKVLTSWNGLMIHALAKASFYFERDDYLMAALQAVRFIQDKLYLNGELLRRYRDGEAKYKANLEDYAFFIKGLLSVFEVTLDEIYLNLALELTSRVEKDFKQENGSYYYAQESSTLLLRKCDLNDGSEPSGNSVHAENLLRLYQLTAESCYLECAEAIFKAAHTHLDDFPLASVYLADVLLRYYSNQHTAIVVVALDDDSSLINEVKAFFNQHYLPHITLLIKESHQIITLPLLQDKKPIDGQTAIYVCRQGACLSPVLGLEELQALLIPIA